MTQRDQSNSHSCYVQIISTGGFFAVCKVCGPDPFPNRATVAEAEADARSHGVLDTRI